MGTKVKVGPLYHVTFVNRLGTIADRGLLPIVPRKTPGGFAAGGLVDHDDGKVYFTGPDGIRYWYARAEVTAVGRSKSPMEHGHVPVVLLVRSLPADLEHDALGERESGLVAFMSSEAVAPHDVELWTGDDWAPLADRDQLDPRLALRRGRFLPCAENALACPSIR